MQRRCKDVTRYKLEVEVQTDAGRARERSSAKASGD